MKSNLYKKLLIICALFLLTLAPFAAKAQNTRELTQEEEDNKKASQKRVALVIGNGAYTKAKPLPNPSNDAADMAQTLRDLGFEVFSGTNQTKRQTETLIREFGAKLAASGGIGLFYYAGHGIQVGGENYIVPVDADIPEEDEVAYSAVPISLVLTKMTTAKNDLNIVILDACRNNPFARSWRNFRDNSNSDGLAKISPPTGTLVLYATEPGKVASDGAGRNGLFTEALLKQIKRPNLEYDQLVKALSADVWQKSNKQQLPWKEGNTLTDFYFVKAQQFITPPKNTPQNVARSNKNDEVKTKPDVSELSGNGVGAGSNYSNEVEEKESEKREKIVIDKDIVFISKRNPEYTDEARRQKVQGIVRLKVTFRADGVIGSISVVQGLSFGLTEKAIVAARYIKFRPAESGGKPVTVTKTVEFNFTIY